MLYEVTLTQTDSDLHGRIITTSRVDHFYVGILKKIQEDRLFQQQNKYKVDDSILLWSKERLYVLDRGDIRSNILTKFHQNPYSGHPKYQKVISTVKKQFFWPKS